MPATDSSRRTRVAVLCSFNVDLVRQPLEDALEARGCPSETYFSGYGQWESDLRNPSSGLYGFAPHVVVLYLDVRDVVPGAFQEVPTAEEAERRGTEAAKALESGVAFLLERLPGTTVFCCGLTMPPRHSLGLLEGNSGYSWRAAVRAFDRQIQALASRHATVFFLDLEALILETGWSTWEDPRLWPVGRMRLARSAYPRLAAFLARAVRTTQHARRKCLVLDLDNTLWGGVVGEDGVEGILLGHSGPGLAYLEFQRAVKSLIHRGVLLAVCSKNNPDDALEVFRSHPGMILKASDFTAMEIGWGDKPAALERIARKIDIGLDSLVFWDDSPVERALVRERLPEVLVPEVPADAADYAAFLFGLEAFDTLVLTGEDLRRSTMYREEARRREVRESMAERTPEEFYRACAIEMTIRRADGFSLPRLAQMVMKTNQFNMSTKRYTLAEIEHFMDDPDVDVYSLQVSDRFGDLGIVGMAIVRRGTDPWELDTFLLSCRALGRTIEHGFLAFLAGRARESGARLRALFVPTARNAPVKRFFDELGLTLSPTEAGGYHISIPVEKLSVPSWLTLKVEA